MTLTLKVLPSENFGGPNWYYLNWYYLAGTVKKIADS